MNHFLTDAVNNATNIWKKIILNLTSKSVQPEFQVLHLSGFREWLEMTSQLARLIQFKSSRSVLSSVISQYHLVNPGMVESRLVFGTSVRNVLLLVPTYFLSEKKYLFELVRKLEVISFQNYDNFHLRATSYPKLINLSLLTLQNSFTLRIILNPRGKWWWPAVMMTLLALQDIKLIRLKPRGMISHRVCD